VEVGGIGRVVDLLDEGGQDAAFYAFTLAGAPLSYEALHFIDLAAGEHDAQKQGVDVLVRMRLFQARQYRLEFNTGYVAKLLEKTDSIPTDE